MISIFGLLFMVMFVLVFLGVFLTIITQFWRMRGMANKVFTLAEQEMDRKLREGSAKGTEAAQCPNCGAGLQV